MAFTRTELRNIRDRAAQAANMMSRQDPLEARAFMELASAANTLDAITARSEANQRTAVRFAAPKPGASSMPNPEQPKEPEVETIEECDEEEDDGVEEVDPADIPGFTG